MRSVFVAGAALVMLALVPVASAQDPAAPHLSPTDAVLYAHHHDADTEELAGWMNTLATDSTANDIALGPSGQFVGAPPAVPARTLTMTLNPGLTGTVILDSTGNIVVTAYIGSGSSNGALRVTTEITYGGETVASGAAQNHVYQASTGQYGVLTWTLAPELTEFAPGKDLVWTITMSGVAQAGFLGVSEERGLSNIALPVLSSTVSGPVGGTGSPPVYEDLDGPNASIGLFGLHDNSTRIYNWTSPGGNLTMDVGGGDVNGSVEVEVLSGNETLANATYTGTAIHRAITGPPGNWSIHVRMANFTGNLSIFIGPPESAPPPQSSPDESTTGPTGDGSQATGSSTSSSKAAKGTPGFAIPAAVAALASVLVLRRRTRP